MKIGKFKKIAAIGLALTMAIGLLYTSGTVNAVDSTNPSVSGGIENENVVTNKTAEYISDGKYKIRLEAYAKGKVQTGVAKDLDIVLVLDQSASMAYNFDGEYTTNNSSRRQYAMKEAVNNFIDSVYENSSGLNSETRVGVVTFGSDSDVLNDLVSIKNNYDYQQLKYKINGLLDEPEGATNVEAGMDSAQDMLSASNGREKVVIVFTDGVPTTSSDFSVDVANKAIAIANSMKNNGTKIYSIGIFNGADISELYGEKWDYEVYSDIACTGEVGTYWGGSFVSSIFGSNDFDDVDIAAGNRFLNYLSNNFLGLTNVGLERGTYAPEHWLNLAAYGTGYKITQNFDRTSSDYYLTASNLEGLNDIFEQISEDISSSSIDLGREAIMTDTLSDYFEFSETNEIEYWTETYNGNKQWTKDSSITGVSPVKNGNKLEVTGFDYSANYVLEEDVDGKPTGKRLVVEFYVEPKEGFIGGNAVPTNNLSQSGIFLENQTVENFPYPKVDVDINYFVESTDLGMYIGDDWNDFENFVLNNDQVVYKTNNSSNDSFKLNEHSYANDFVTITYTIKDGDTEVGKYVINASDTKGTWTKNVNIDTTKYTNTKNFTIEVSVTNNENEISNDLDNKTQNSSISSPLESTLYIFIPNINTEDDTLFLNDSAVNLIDYVTLSENVKWTCNDSTLNNNLDKLNEIKETLGNKPTLTYEFEINNENETGFSPDKIGIYEVNLKVKNGIDITEHSHFNHDNTLDQCEANPCGNPHYFLKVEAGSITITKSFDNANYDYTDGNPIFIFKVTDDNGNSYYQNVKFKKNDDNDKLVGVIEGLGIGNYQIEELESLRFEESDFGWSYTEGTYTNNTKGIMLNKENRHAYARFTNVVKSSKYDSDNDIIVNEFTRNADGSISWNGKNLSVKE